MTCVICSTLSPQPLSLGRLVLAVSSISLGTVMGHPNNVYAYVFSSTTQPDQLAKHPRQTEIYPKLFASPVSTTPTANCCHHQSYQPLFFSSTIAFMRLVIARRARTTSIPYSVRPATRARLRVVIWLPRLSTGRRRADSPLARLMPVLFGDNAAKAGCPAAPERVLMAGAFCYITTESISV